MADCDRQNPTRTIKRSWHSRATELWGEEHSMRVSQPTSPSLSPLSLSSLSSNNVQVTTVFLQQTPHLSDTVICPSEITEQTSVENNKTLYWYYTPIYHHNTLTPVCYIHRMIAFCGVFLGRVIDGNLPKSSIDFCFDCKSRWKFIIMCYYNFFYCVIIR